MFIFGLFKQTIQFLQQIYVKKCHDHPVYVGTRKAPVWPDWTKFPGDIQKNVSDNFWWLYLAKNVFGCLGNFSLLQTAKSWTTNLAIWSRWKRPISVIAKWWLQSVEILKRRKLLLLWAESISIINNYTNTSTVGSGCGSVGKQSLLIPEVCGSNPVISKNLYWTFSFQLYWKDKKKRKKRLGIAHFYNTATVKAPWFRIKLIVEINFDCCWNEKKVENKKEAGIVPIKKQLHKLWAVVVAQLAEQWSVAQIRSSTILLTIKCTKTVL